LSALILSIAWAVLIAWLLVHAVSQYRHYQGIPTISDRKSQPARDEPSIAIIVPARNEAHNIAKCLDGLVVQEYAPRRLSIVVVDDGSTDGTGEIIRGFVRDDPRVTLVQGLPLPHGWAGKPHACWQAVAAPVARAADWLCFVDADTVAAPLLIRSAVAAAETRGLDMLSLSPFQELVTCWERLVIPCGFFLLAFTQDLRRVNDPASSKAAANGQFLLFRREVYEAIGGHAAVPCELSEDTALARRVKAADYRFALLGAETLICTRMFTGLQSVWEGVSKNVTEMIGGLTATAGAAALGLLLAFASILLPIWEGFRLADSHTPIAIAGFIVALAASLALFGTHLGAARYFRIPIGYGLMFPLGYTLGAVVALHGVAERLRGQVIWKGRTYAPPTVKAGAP
jgi:chlorobactene glucosyltransferase